MTIDWPSYWAGIITVPLAAAAIALLLYAASRAFSTNLGLDGCHVCDQGFSCEVGDYTRLGIWFRSRRHQWFIRNQKWHRDAWARNRWNPYRLPGYPQDTATAAPRRKNPNALVRAWWAIFD